MGHYTEMGYSYLTKWIIFKNYLLSGEIKNNLPKDWMIFCCMQVVSELKMMFLRKLKKSQWNENENNFEIFIKNDEIKILSDIFYKKKKKDINKKY